MNSQDKESKRINDFIASHRTWSNEKLAKRFGLSVQQARNRRTRVARKTTRRVAEKPKRQELSPEQQLAKDMKVQGLLGKKKATDKKYQTAIETLRRTQAELEAVIDLKNGMQTHVIKPRVDSGQSEATAVVLASDWHVEEKVDSRQINGLNRYSPDIAKSRANQFFRNALRLVEIQRHGTRIDTLVLALLGDFITNHLHEEATESNYMLPIEAAIYAQGLLASGIQFLLDSSNLDLVIVCHSGNHGRTTKKVHFGNENGHSLEYYMYHSLRDHFRGSKRVTFVVSEGSHTYLEANGHTLRFLHGHDVKFGGGVGGITIPIRKAIAQWDRAKKADITCMGHFHQFTDGGTFVTNGSLIGYNAFALSIKAEWEPPKQAFFLIDKKRGKTIVAPITFEE